MAALPLNVNQLIVLAAVVEHGSFTRAAEALHVTQPSVSQQIRELERACALPLVEARGRQLAPTALGAELAALGRRIALDARRGAKLVADHVAGVAGKLSIGASMTTGAYYVPRVLAALRATRPGIVFDVAIANTADVAQATVDELVDVGVVEGTVERPELLYTHAGHDTLACIVASGDALCGREVGLATLLERTLLLREAGSGTREAVVATLAAHGAHFERTIDVGSNDAIVQSVAEGLGIAWLSQRAVAASTGRRIGTIPVRDVSVARELGVLRRRDRAPLPVAQAFIEALLSECAAPPRARS